MHRILKHRCGLNPEQLSDEEFVEAVRDYMLLVKFENEILCDTITNALLKFWNLINKK